MPLLRNLTNLGKRLRISTGFDELSNELTSFPSGTGLAGTPICASKTFGMHLPERASQSPMPKRTAQLHEYGRSPSRGANPARAQVPILSLPFF